MVRFSATGGKTALPPWARTPRKVLDFLSEPKGTYSDSIVAFVLSKEGIIFVLFERKEQGMPIVSPTASMVSVNGTEVRFGWIGERALFRWRQNGIEYTLLTKVPPNLVMDFLTANITK